MRSVNAATKAPRSRGRATATRRSSPPRAGAGRETFGKRTKFRSDPISRSLRTLKTVLDPRRPRFLLGSIIVIMCAVAVLHFGGYLRRASTAAGTAGASVVGDANLEISTIQLKDNHYTAPGVISASLGFGPGDSIFAVDPQLARSNLRKLDWVSDAVVSVRYPDTVLIRIVEKTPFALWQSDHGLYVVNREGRPITLVAHGRFKGLPYFFGDAPNGAVDLVQAIARHRAVFARVKAMQRVTDRRWNLILDDGVVIKLPEEGWANELATLERLIVENGVLERDIGEIDLRSHDNYIFVLRHPAPRKNSRGEPT